MFNAATPSAPLIPGSSNFDTNYTKILEVEKLTDGTCFLEAGTLSNLLNPVNALDAANKQYVDAAVSAGPLGILSTWKYTAVAASTANIDLSTNAPATIDGITLTINDRILLKNQTDTTENGIYIFISTATTLSRSADAAVGVLASGATIYIYAGTTNAGKFFYIPSITSTPPYTINFGSSISANRFGIAVPAGLTTQVQFNSGGVFAGSSNFTYDGTSLTLIPTNKLVLNTIESSNITTTAYLYNNQAGSINVGNSGSSTNVTITGSSGSIAFTSTNVELTGSNSTNQLTPADVIIKSGNYTGTVPTINSGKIYLRPGVSTNTDNGYVSIEGTHSSISITSGLLVVSGGVGIGGNANIASITKILSTANSNSYTSGGLIVSGGVGIAKDVYTSIASTVYIQNTTDSTSNTTGSMIVSGGIGLASGKSIYTNKVTGLSAPTANSDAANKAYVDSYVTNNAAGSNTQIQYNNNGALGASANFTYNGSSVSILNGTESTGVNSGALIVSGGMGLSKNLNIGGVTTINNTTDTTSLGTGALIVSGGASIYKSVIYGTSAVVSLLATGNSTDVSTGILKIAGGIGIQQDLWANIINSNLPIINYGTGADGSFTVSSGDLYLTRDANFINLTINNANTLYPQNNRIYCTGLFFNRTGAIVDASGNDGGDAVDSTPGIAGTAAAMSLGQGAGGVGGALNSVGGNAETVQSFRGNNASPTTAGGSGGTSGNGNAGGVSTIYSGKPSLRSNDVRMSMCGKTQFAASGGSGGGGGSQGAGGGGGSGGGCVWICARTYENLGTIRSKGGRGGKGAGASGGGSPGGGGGSGNGGIIVLAFDSFIALGTIQNGTQAAGAAGTGGTGVASAGSVGNDGYYVYYNARTGVWTGANDT